MPLVNEYVKRTAKDEASCFVCHKPTTVVLVSAKSQPADWFYSCASHLEDRGFCQCDAPAAVETSKTAASDKPAVDDAKDKTTKPATGNVKSDQTNGSGKEDDQGAATSVAQEKTAESTAEGAKVQEASTPRPADAGHPAKYILHRNIFYLREARLASKQRAISTNQMLNRMPVAPKTSPRPNGT
ncbi:VPS4-associated protein 1 [Thamnocephalis sphaerospora]|uniref:VPS4-associated protein 1 n=1 Tax=Thamnocephalis sphaerospora TaxID=78915 RepID=A0A4P9XQG3_9FUNG|nr:VPS4-associated protein 1 [Thamnocephalis sphaerospora]|eukprot:RKP08268.1 VPS4-associated protein 1 [Thamnocephalis sphaerospora]